jgi:hypothetical protein
MISYGGEPFLYRVPGYDLDALIRDLRMLEFSGRSTYPFGEWHDLFFQPMVNATITPDALFHAGRVLKDLEGKDDNIRSSAILLVIDVHEPEINIYEAVDIVTSSGINVHIASVTDDDEGIIASGFNQHIQGNPRAYYYDISDQVSEREILRAAQRMSELETMKVPVASSRTSYDMDLTPDIALWLYFVVFTFILLTETVLRKTRTPNQERRE